MPRTPRRDAPGAVHHVMLRGIERREIFRDDRDRRALLYRLSTVLPECGATCYAWAFMPNHLHLVVRTGSTPLARAMSRIGTGHAQYFNKRHQRVGHLFQNRYKSIPVDCDQQLRTLIRYVHLNPERAGIVADIARLERYSWTGHAGLMGRTPAGFHGVRAALDLFGDDPDTARRSLRTWMRAGDEKVARAGEGPARLPDLDPIVAAIARAFGVAPDEIARGSRRRQVCQARAVIAHLACDQLALAKVEVAPRLGVGEAAIRTACDRGRALLQREARTVPQVRGK